ncbi:MAG: hypothetical protein N2692_02185 [Patescibacteria group bacterium]|nr:hypothetical protein [Patescibacteria group bacterium]
MRPQITELRFEWEKYWIYFVAIPTKNGKKKPKLKYIVKEGSLIQENEKIDIPAEIKNQLYRRAAIVFNKL